jgi:adenylate kinase family enzyme
MVAVVFIMGVSGSGKTTIGEGLGTNYPSRNAIQFNLIEK